MKKYRLLIFSILLSLVSVAVLWYMDQLAAVSVLIPLLLLFVLLVLFILLLIFSIRRIIKNKSRIDIAGAAVLLLLVAVIWLVPIRDAAQQYQFNRYEGPRLEVIEMIKNEQLKGQSGNIALPAEYKRLSSGGEVFEYQNDENGQVIGFWIRRGLPDDSILLIYTSGGEDLIRDNIGPGIQHIEKLKDQWYYVTTY